MYTRLKHYTKLSVDSIHVGRYKDGYGKPLYSFDLRHQSPGGEGVLWASEDGGATPRAQLSVRSELEHTAFSAFGDIILVSFSYICKSPILEKYVVSNMSTSILSKLTRFNVEVPFATEIVDIAAGETK